MTDKFINPLDLVSESSEDQNLKSESAMDNNVPGVCPKCKLAMISDAQLPDGETVFYCTNCRVTSPKPEIL